jgi:D-alanyl-D-alanine carboxypeptidase
MRRRDFLKAVVGVVVGAGFAPEVLAGVAKIPPTHRSDDYDSHIKDYLHKMRNFNVRHRGDVCLDRRQFQLLKSCVNKFKRVQRTVGHGNFYLLSFDEAISIARNYSRVGRFTRAELDFLEMVFYFDASNYGFFGKKPVKDITDRVKRREVVKILHTGNYLYRGMPLQTYKKIIRGIGDGVVLTSGIRSVTKQFLLFLNKAYGSEGNLSLASRSLAPPGYSYHGIGDFDVGQAGLGPDNFTERFTTTSVYKRLNQQGYVRIRYPMDNMLGVRFEPWHIKVGPQA